MAETLDRSKDIVVIYDKAGNKVTEGEVGTGTATITGLTAGTVVADGDYQAAFKDSVTGEESSKVDIQGWTVLTPAPEAPTDVASTATTDGATITAKQPIKACSLTGSGGGWNNLKGVIKMTELLKMEIGWGTLKASDIVDYVPIVISVEDYKYITGQEYQEVKKDQPFGQFFCCIKIRR